MELDRLIETERRNDERIRRARDEAREIVEEARRAVAAREAALQAEIDTEVGEQERQLRAEHDRRLADLTTAGRNAATRYSSIAPGDIQRVLPALLGRLLERDAAS